MNGNAHALLSCLTTFGALELIESQGLIGLSPHEKVLALTVAGVAAWMPDVDSSESTISRMAPWAGAAGMALYWLPPVNGFISMPNDLAFLHQLFPALTFQQVIGIMLIACAVMILAIHSLDTLYHRGPTHSLAVWVLTSIGVGSTLALLNHPNSFSIN